MNQRSLIAVIILAGIGSITAVSAYSGSISAAQGNFNNVLVTGTCTGCSGEGSFTNYSVLLNQTIGGSTASNIVQLSVSNDGSILGYDQTNKASIVSVSGTLISYASEADSGTNTGLYQHGQSATGEYKIYSLTTSLNEILVYKNNVLLQTIHINPTQFSFGNLGSESIAISPNGEYIVIYGIDSGLALEREVILKGS